MQVVLDIQMTTAGAQAGGILRAGSLLETTGAHPLRGAHPLSTWVTGGIGGALGQITEGEDPLQTADMESLAQGTTPRQMLGGTCMGGEVRGLHSGITPLLRAPETSDHPLIMGLMTCHHQGVALLTKALQGPNFRALVLKLTVRPLRSMGALPRDGSRTGSIPPGHPI